MFYGMVTNFALGGLSLVLVITSIYGAARAAREDHCVILNCFIATMVLGVIMASFHMWDALSAYLSILHAASDLVD